MNSHQYEPSTELIRKTEVLLANTGQKFISMEYLGKGEGSFLYRILTSKQELCMKIALFPQRAQKVLHEAEIRNNFIAKGLNFVPKPMLTDPHFPPNGCVIYHFVPGKPCLFQREEEIRQIAQILAQIHSINYTVILDGFKQMYEEFQAFQKTIDKIILNYPDLVNSQIKNAFSKSLQEYEQKLSQNQDKFTIGIKSNLHGDLSNNCIIDPKGKLWLIDWENSEFGDILSEISFFIYNNNIPAEKARIFYHEYQNHFPLSKQIDLATASQFYRMMEPVYNICWGIDQLASNLKHHLEPFRKVNDICNSAENWGLFYSKSTTELIMNGTSELRKKIEKIL